MQYILYPLLIVVGTVVGLGLGAVILKYALKYLSMLLLIPAEYIREVVDEYFGIDNDLDEPFRFHLWYIVFIVPPFCFVVLYILLVTFLLFIFSGMECLSITLRNYRDADPRVTSYDWNDRSIWLTVFFVPVGLFLFLGVLLLLISAVSSALAKAIYHIVIDSLIDLAHLTLRMYRLMARKTREFIRGVRIFSVSLIRGMIRSLR